MSFIQLIVLSLVQGITEFLPVSSSAHLVLVPVLTGWPDQGLVFDVAAHAGTLAAVLCYYRNDIAAIANAWLKAVFHRQQSDLARLAWYIIWASFPLGLIGLLSKDIIEQLLRNPLVIAGTTVIFGILLGAAAMINRPERALSTIRFIDVLWIGLAQTLALIPGVSRSGITITAGLLRHFKPDEATRFAFLLSIPAISMPVCLYLFQYVQGAASPWPWSSIIWVFALAFFSALICMHGFLILLGKLGLWPFVLYRLLLGSLLFAYFW